MHLNEVVDHFELSNDCLLRIATHDASSHCWMTQELQSTLEASGFEWPAMRNH